MTWYKSPSQMVVLEAFVASSLYTAGNVANYFIAKHALKQGEKLTDGSKVEELKDTTKFVECSTERVEQDAPMFLNTGGQHLGLIVPIGGGSHIDTRKLLTGVLASDPKASQWNWTITDLDGRPCTVPKRFWLNSADDLKQYFGTNGIPQDIAPLSIPMSVREVHIPAGLPVYAVRARATAGTNLDSVVREVVGSRTIHRSRFLVAGVCAAVTGSMVWSEWKQYKHISEYAWSGGTTKHPPTLAGFLRWKYNN